MHLARHLTSPNPHEAYRPHWPSRQMSVHHLLTYSDNSTIPAKMGYEDSVYLAKLAEQAERYEGKSDLYEVQERVVV